MNLELVALVLPFVFFIGLALVERVFAARPLPKLSWWRLKGVAFFVLVGVLSTFAPMLWIDFASAHRLMDLEWTGLALGAVIAFVGTQFFSYWWHRLMHNSDLLWRWFHQMHHSAERLDVYGANYFHPLDVVGFAFVTTVVPTMVLGVSAEAGAIAGLTGLFYSLFQHTNVRTPRWLGYVIQRPESHSVHHGRGIHAYNYADLPIWDMVFGTFKNPARFESESGFWDGASKRVAAMLLGRDVAEVPLAKAGAVVPTSAARPQPVLKTV
jgi:sterol desaturase/sphingolipid hydroxylase (fatty acid hydroxylase superfamily)